MWESALFRRCEHAVHGEARVTRISYRLEPGTRLGLQPVADGRTMISHCAITVAPFDRQALVARLRELRADVLPSPDEPDVVRFLDNNGITVEVRVAG